MKPKSNRDYYQGQNEALKSALHILNGLLLECHIIYFLNWKKFEIFTTSTYAIFASSLKISAQNFDFWPLFRGVKDCWYGILTFLKVLWTCELGELVAWYLVDKRGAKANPWKGGGLRFNSGWWWIDTMTCRWRPWGGG
jgi:hypothetical protein